jgi:hypothetical protein
MPTPNRTLDFAGATPVRGHASSGEPGASRAASPLGAAPSTPVALEELLASLPSAEAGGGAAAAAAGGHGGGAGPAGGDGRGGAGPAGGDGRGGARRGVRALLLLALLAGGVAAAIVALPDPAGAALSLPQQCGLSNAAECAAAYRAFFESDLDSPLPAWRAAALSAKWAVQDWVVYAREGRLPWGAAASDGAAPPLPPPLDVGDAVRRAERALADASAARERGAREQQQAAAAAAAATQAAAAAAAKAEAAAAEQAAAVAPAPTPAEQAPEVPAPAEEPAAAAVPEAAPATREPAQPAAPAQRWAPSKSAGACPAWLPLHSMATTFPDCHVYPIVLDAHAALASPAPSLVPAPKNTCIDPAAASRLQGAKATPPGRRSWPSAAAAAVRAVLLGALVLAACGGAAAGAAFAAKDGRWHEWAGAAAEAMNNIRASVAAAALPEQGLAAAAGTAHVLAVRERILTPRLKV